MNYLQYIYKMSGGGELYNKYGFDSIEDVKEYLRNKGLKPDGIIGKETIKSLLKDLGVKADGIWGPKSEAALADKLIKTSNNSIAPNDITKQSGTISIPDYEEPWWLGNGENWTINLFSNNSGSWGGGRSGGGGAGGRYRNPESEIVLEKKPNLIMYVEETKKSFNSAFAEARRKGLKTFIFNGKKYSTDITTDPEKGKKAQEAGNKRFETRVDGFVLPFKYNYK